MVPIICKWAQDINSSIFWVLLFVNMDAFWGDFMFSISVINLNCQNKMAKCCQMHIFKNCTIQYALTVADVQICCLATNVYSDCIGCIYCIILHNMVPNCTRCIKCYMRGNIQVILPKYAKKCQHPKKSNCNKNIFATYTWSRLTVTYYLYFM